MSPPSHPSRRPGAGFAPADALALAALLATAIVVAWCILRVAPAVGQWQDDGIYLVTAKSLADGEGYRRPELPDQPWQTKYPILYPALLSLVWRAWPAFPDNVAAMRLLAITLSAGGFACAYVVLRRQWRLPPFIAGLAVVASFANLAWVGLLATPMSEPLFALLANAAVLLAGGTMLRARGPGAAARARDADSGASAVAFAEPASAGCPAAAPATRASNAAAAAVVTAGICGLLAGAAFLTRTIGLALLPAVVVPPLLARRWGAAALAAALSTACVAGWWSWRASAERENAALPHASRLVYELRYGAWMPRDAATAVRVAWQNAPAASLALLDAIAQPSRAWVERSLAGGLTGALPLYLGMAAVTLLAALGASAVCTRAAIPSIAYLACYGGLALVWPFTPGRFVAVVLPYALAAVAAGIYVVAAWVVRLFDAAAESERGLLALLRAEGVAGHLVAGRSGADLAWRAVAVAAAIPLLRIFWITTRPAALQDGSAEARSSFVELLHARTPPDAVIAVGDGGYLHLETGRRFVLVLPIDDAISLLYSPDRRWSLFGCGFTEAEVARTRTWIAASLIPYLRATGATHVVFRKESELFSILMREYCESHPGEFPLIADHAVGTLHRFGARAE